MTTLREISEAIIDCEHKTAPVGDGFAYSVGTKAMKDGRLLLDACKPVSETTYEAWTRRMQPRPGDLILAREAPVGQVVRVPQSPLLCLGQRTVLIRPDSAKIDPRFLHYWLLGPVAQRWMEERSAGATVPHLNVEDIRELHVASIPHDRELQRFAATTLGALDELIEVNAKRIALLEEMARAIYREWFVKFRFPGSNGVTYVETALGPIPEGWSLMRVADLAARARNAVSSGPFGSKLGRKDYTGDGVPVLRGANLRVGGGFDESDLVFVSEAKAEQLRSSLARRGDVVVTQRGTLGQVGLISPWSRFDRYVLSQSQMKITVDDSIATSQFVYAQLRTPDTTARFVAQAMTAGVPHVNLQILREFQLVMPPVELQRRFSSEIEPIAGLVALLAAGTKMLVQIRNGVLPRLVSGRLGVPGRRLDVALESLW